MNHGALLFPVGLASLFPCVAFFEESAKRGERHLSLRFFGHDLLATGLAKPGAQRQTFLSGPATKALPIKFVEEDLNSRHCVYFM